MSYGERGLEDERERDADRKGEGRRRKAQKEKKYKVGGSISREKKRNKYET